MFHAMSEFRAGRLALRHLNGIGGTEKLGSGLARQRMRTWVVESLENRAMLSTITVSSTGDTGLGTLRAAIEQDNLDAAQDTITFAPAVAGTITLLSPLPDLSTDVILSGPGASALTVSRSNAVGTPVFGIFNVAVGVEVVSISGLTITGGGISNGGTLTLTD
jgi:hypothetical protein